MRKTTIRRAAQCAFAALAGAVLVTAASAAQLTAEQLAAMRARAEESRKYLEEITAKMMVEAEARAAARPPVDPVAAQRAAEGAARAREAQFLSEIAPWLIQELPMPDNSPLTSEAVQVQNAKDLMALSATFFTAYQARDAEVENFVKTNPWGFQADGFGANGGRYIIDAFDALGAPMVKSTLNLESAQTVSAQRLWPGGSSGFNLTGSNVLIGEWDGGDVQTNHQEFWLNESNVRLLNPPTNGIDWHATHVAGVLAAYGGYAPAIGFANRAEVLASWNRNDFREMPSVVATNALRVSNHSYGYIGGWQQFTIFGSNAWLWAGNDAISVTQDWHFGFYDGVARTNDMIIYAAQTYLPLFAAGNARGPGQYRPPTQPFNHWEYYTIGGTLYLVYTNGIRPLNDAQNGFNNLTSYAVSKNDLVVGAVVANTNGYTGTNGVAMSTFSSWGPPADGRIKPDICAAGVGIAGGGIISTYATNQTVTNLYAAASGTSQAAPAVAGTVGLLTQLYSQFYGATNPPLASTLKGIIIQTADQAGANAGPSYNFGWGQMNALTAAHIVSNNYGSGSLAYIKECRLVNGDSIAFPVSLTNGVPFKVTIAWTDPAGTPVAPAVNPTNHMLVNDLDLRVVSPTAVTNFPYVLNRASPGSAATMADNTVDNVEQVFIPNPATGIYTVQVTHKGSLVDDQGQTNYQNVSILMSGNIAQPAIEPSITQITAGPTSNTVALKWACDVGRVCRAVYVETLLSTNNNWQFATGELSATKTNTSVLLSTAGVTNRFYRVLQVR